jgi:hypothetical protein
MVNESVDPGVQPEIVNVKSPCGNCVAGSGFVGGTGAEPGGAASICAVAKLQVVPPPVNVAVTVPLPVAEGPVNVRLAITVEDVALLLAGAASVVAAATLTVLLIVEPIAFDALAVTVSVRVADAPLASVPIAQLMVVVPVHDPCEGVAETNVVFAGNEPAITTPDEVAGPLLVTVIA